ncbi:hypothetical protein HELRODRAFT_134312, partial [Helobdella robusta]|uniref:Chloride channel protein n=1 Tax=Helobdella robusta TaxID=6412 RepID=T1EI43_HELRO
GAFALVGAASFFGGVSRLTMSLAVIMVELTNDVQFLLPIMSSIMVSKWVGDLFTHPYYLSLLEHKCIPYLHADPVVNVDGRRSASDVMAHPVVMLTCKERVSRLASVLLQCNHGGFPVNMAARDGRGDGGGEVFFGLISRLQLIILLKNEKVFQRCDLENVADHRRRRHRCHHHVVDDDDTSEGPRKVPLLSYLEVVSCSVARAPYVNQSAVSIPRNFSLHRAYIIFRALGLRHMVVHNGANMVVGIITRKDL